MDESFSDIFNDIQFAGMLFYCARKGRFGITGDLEYSQTLSKDDALVPFFGGEFGGVGYRITDSITSTLGYRWVKVDYESNDFLYDVRQQGIATGLSFAF